MGGRGHRRLLVLPMPIEPFHIESTKAYKCVALLYGNRFTLLKNMKHPKPWGGPDFSKIFIGYADKVTKIIVVGLDEGERVLDGPVILGRPKDWE